MTEATSETADDSPMFLWFHPFHHDADTQRRPAEEARSRSAMTDPTTHTVDATLAAIGSKATYTGAGTTLFGWLTSNEFAVLAGVLLGVAGFMVNWYYRHKEDRRRQAEHEQRMGMYE